MDDEEQMLYGEENGGGEANDEPSANVQESVSPKISRLEWALCWAQRQDWHDAYDMKLSA